MNIYWTVVSLAWLLFFAIGESYAFANGKATLSQWVWEISVAWPAFEYLAGFVTGGLAVHFWWHWMPAGASNVG